MYGGNRHGGLKERGRCSRLALGIHLAEQASQGRCVAGRERSEFFAEAALADSANLISGDLGRFARDLYPKARPPVGMQPAGERADHHGFQRAVEHVEADDHRRSRFAQLAPRAGSSLTQ